LRRIEREKMKEGVIKELTQKESSHSFIIESNIDSEEEKAP